MMLGIVHDIVSLRRPSRPPRDVDELQEQRLRQFTERLRLELDHAGERPRSLGRAEDARV